MKLDAMGRTEDERREGRGTDEGRRRRSLLQIKQGSQKSFKGGCP